MPDRLRFRVIGPVEFHNRGGWHGIGSAMQRDLLAALIIKANRVVSIGQIYEQLWGQDPPASAKTLVAGYVWRLRQRLGDWDGHTIVTRAPGYLLSAPPGSIDVECFEVTVAAAHADLAAGRAEAAVAGFNEALTLWRDVPLADVRPTPPVTAEVNRLEEARLAAQEARLAAELELGRHVAVLPELKQLVAQHPLRERLHAHLMLAMYRNGQQAMALVAYRDLRSLLIDELGIEPSTELRELQQRILCHHPSLRRGAATIELSPVPPASDPGARLPAEPLVLVGRGREAGELVEAVRTKRIAVIHGLVGAGKTALAVHVAHRLAAEFPDGPRFVDYGADADTPAAPHRPQGRELLVLDNVTTAEQVLALGPVPPGCGVLVTSPSALPALPDVARVRVGALSPDASLHMLRAHLGATRVDLERHAADLLVRRCDGLPAALQIAAVQLAGRPALPIQAFVDQLADPVARLDALACQDVSLRDRLMAAAWPLIGSSRQALRLIGEADLPLVTVEVLARLLGAAQEGAEVIVERLVGAGLAEPLPAGRYGVPELMRIFAREHGEGPARLVAAPVPRSPVGHGDLIHSDLIHRVTPSAAIMGE